MKEARRLQATSAASIVHFELGDYAGSEFAAPPQAAEAAMRELRDGIVRYEPGPGLPALREAIAEFMKGRGCSCTADEVVVTTGAKHALHMTLLALLNDGDEIIVPDPGYPPDYVWAQFAGARVVPLPLTPPRWTVDPQRLRELISKRTKALIINTPQRPNGEMVNDLEEIAQICAEAGVLVISDEIFSQIVYDGNRHCSISQYASTTGLQCVVIDTFSKTYTMTGWRIGWCVAPREIARALSIFLQDSVTNVPLFTQHAALAALGTPASWVAARVDLLQRRRDRMVAELQTVPGMRVSTPPATFYVFPDVSQTGLTSDELTAEALSAGVAVVAGSAFGSMGRDHVRLTFAVPEEELIEGCRRLRSHFSEKAMGAPGMAAAASS
jgi:aspartate/methionine/tyrosine aminotransferase